MIRDPACAIGHRVRLDLFEVPGLDGVFAVMQGAVGTLREVEHNMTCIVHWDDPEQCPHPRIDRRFLVDLEDFTIKELELP